MESVDRLQARSAVRNVLEKNYDTGSSGFRSVSLSFGFDEAKQPHTEMRTLMEADDRGENEHDNDDDDDDHGANEDGGQPAQPDEISMRQLGWLNPS